MCVCVKGSELHFVPPPSVRPFISPFAAELVVFCVHPESAPQLPTRNHIMRNSRAASDRDRDRFGAVPLSPRRNDPLLVPGSASLDAMASGCMAISLRVVAAMSLRAMKKGITSNPFCEISLVHHDGSSQRREHNAWHMGQDLTIDQKINGSQSNQPGLSRELAQTTTRSKPFKTTIVKSSLNPIWDFDVDFGDVDTETVVGVVFTVKHAEKFGMVKKDIGELFLSLREIMDLKMVRIVNVHRAVVVGGY